jgi:hypothetical protein
MFYSVIVLVTIISCSKGIDDNSVIFNDNGIIYIGNKMIIPSLLKLDDAFLNGFAFDQITGKYWFHFIKDGQSEFCYLQEDGELSNPINMNYKYNEANIKPAKGGIGFFVNNSIALFSTESFEENGLLANGYINNNSYRKSIDIIANLNDLSYRFVEVPLEILPVSGFSGNIIFGQKAFFNVTDRYSYNIPDGLRYWRYMPKIDFLLFLKKDNTIASYDYHRKKYIEYQIVIKKRQGFEYSAEDLYYLDDEYLYFSKSVGLIPSFLYIIPTFVYGPISPREWYRYNQHTQETVLIKSPSKYSVIIGRN